jgi:N-acetylglucosamine-6-phosphate deacetylase
MSETTRLAIFAKRIITPEIVIPDGIICIEGTRILEVGRRNELRLPTGEFQEYHFTDRVIVPGFIDLHVHGGGGHDFMEGTRDAVEVISRHLSRHGTTAYLATTVSASPIATIRAAENLGKLVGQGLGGAIMVGLHLEGPFISEAKKGVHPPAFLRNPSIRIFDELLKMSANTIKLVTLAPELEGALEFIKSVRSRGIHVSLGHSNATFEETLWAVELGASQATHSFNAMRDFNHREPGILGAILTDGRVWAEIIADGVHVHPAVIDILIRCKGAHKTLLITDAITATGMPDGQYKLGELTVKVVQGVCRNTDGNLAGSTLTQDQALRNVIQWSKTPLEEAVLMCTLNPAQAIGIDSSKGSLEPGKDADLVVLDQNLEIQATLSSGQWTYVRRAN